MNTSPTGNMVSLQEYLHADASPRNIAVRLRESAQAAHIRAAAARVAATPKAMPAPPRTTDRAQSEAGAPSSWPADKTSAPKDRNA